MSDDGGAGGRGRACAKKPESRLARRSSATAATSRSKWPRWRCRERDVGLKHPVVDRPAGRYCQRQRDRELGEDATGDGGRGAPRSWQSRQFRRCEAQPGRLLGSYRACELNFFVARLPSGRKIASEFKCLSPTSFSSGRRHIRSVGWEAPSSSLHTLASSPLVPPQSPIVINDIELRYSRIFGAVRPMFRKLPGDR